MKKTILKSAELDTATDRLDSARMPSTLSESYNASMVAFAVASGSTITSWFASLYRQNGDDAQATLDSLTAAIVVQPFTPALQNWLQNSLGNLVNHTGILGEGRTLRRYFKGRQTDAVPAIDTADCTPLLGVRGRNEHDTATSREHIMGALWSAPINGGKGKTRGKTRGKAGNAPTTDNPRIADAKLPEGERRIENLLSLAPKEREDIAKRLLESLSQQRQASLVQTVLERFKVKTTRGLNKLLKVA